MDFSQLLSLIEERQEKIFNQEPHSIITTTHRYFRRDGLWQEDIEPGQPKQAWGRGGSYWKWEKQTEQPNG